MSDTTADPETTPVLEATKQRVRREVESRSATLVEISRAIHARPELGYEEHHAHDLLTTVLEGEGLEVRRHHLGLATAFAATAGAEGPLVAVLCEYDALPGIGHACGHNVIAAAGLGAGLAAAAIADRAGGRVLILGSPAEEGGGGKVRLMEAGAFDGVEAAMMVHPADRDLTQMTSLAYQQLEADYHGEAAHAAAAPWKGRNALDAAVLGYVNVAALRQHIEPGERVHGIFTRAGDKPNIVPAHTSAFWYVRSPTMAALQPLKARVLACLEAGAAAAGCTMEHRWGERPYAEVKDNQPLLAAYVANMRRLGREVTEPGSAPVVGSTDMGNVSQVLPAIHPMIKVAPTGVHIHSAPFADHAGSPTGDQAVLDGAMALAMTVIDVWADADLRSRARDALQQATGPDEH